MKKRILNSFPTKEGFLSRVDRAKHRLFPRGGTADNYRLLTGLLDLLESRLSEEASQRVEACVASATHLSLYMYILYITSWHSADIRSSLSGIEMPKLNKNI